VYKHRIKACTCKLGAYLSPGITLCERRVHQEKLANAITPSAGGIKEVVTTSSVK